MKLYKQNPLENPQPTKEEIANMIKEIHNHEADIARHWLGQAIKEGTFVCPVCGRGSAEHSHKDGLYIGDNGRLMACYSCGSGGDGTHSGDIIKLYQDTYHVGFVEAVMKLYHDEAGGCLADLPKITPPAPKPKPKVDYTEYFRRCKQYIGRTDYHRGISQKTLDRFWIGYDAYWRHPKVVANYKGKGWQPPATPRLIIPTSNYSYFARRTGNIDKRTDKLYVGEGVPFNLKALQKHNGENIFVVEGEIDAMSFVDVGAEAIGLGGSRGGGGLLDAEALKHFTGKLFVVGDTDGKQDKQYTALCKQLQAQGVACEYVEGRKLFGTAKDANEALNADREKFRSRIKELFEND